MNLLGSVIEIVGDIFFYVPRCRKRRFKAISRLNVEMIITIDNILQSDYEYSENRGTVGAFARPNQQVIVAVIPKEYEAEVKALCAYAGVDTLMEGMTIKMTLQEILGIIPKKRARIESYRMLTQFLKETMNVDLILTSRKTK
jgi:hypothetical protein